MKKRALISVYNKEGIVPFAKALVDQYDFEIISTGGTAKLLKSNNIAVTEISELTQFPEMLEGRVKTLHPAVHGGLLARRDKKEHTETIEKHNIKPIDLVVINLYPFEEITKDINASREDAIENIDIGGPAMIRSAAKNYQAVTVVCDVADLPNVLNDIKEHNGITSLSLREQLAIKAFKRTSEYDKAITTYLSRDFYIGEKNGDKDQFENELDFKLTLKHKLRYGENPHQKAALYVRDNSDKELAHADIIQGKELSFNNYLDLDSAWNISSEFDSKTPVAVIVKHNNPCGVAIAPDLLHAYIEAFNVDPISAFGGIVAFNQRVEKNVAEEMIKVFLEAVIAIDYSPEALEIFKSKPNLRVLKIKIEGSKSTCLDIRRIGEGYLVQDFNSKTISPDLLKVVTKKKPKDEEMVDLVFAWKICKHVKSNAIVIAKHGKCLGIGAGQSNRVASVEIALNQSSYDSAGAVLASDAFFPFKDSIKVAASAKISAIIQPGGSLRDKEVIEACDKYGIAMVFTGMRHFRH